MASPGRPRLFPATAWLQFAGHHVVVPAAVLIRPDYLPALGRITGVKQTFWKM